MEKTTVEKVNKLLEQSKNIKDLFEKKIPLWKSKPTYYDKTGYSFNGDDRFYAFKPFEISFSCAMGIYGDSSCSRELELDRSTFYNHFVAYLNDHKQEIMLDVAKRIDNQAKDLKQKALDELTIEIKKIEAL